MKIFKIELKRAVINKNMLITLLVGIAITLPHTISNFINEKAYMNYISAMDLTSGADLTSLYGRWFGMSSILQEMYFYILPVLAVYPAAMIYFRDRKSGYLKNLYTRCSKKKCLLAKYIAVFISGGIAAAAPLVFAFLTTALYAPARVPDSTVMNHLGGASMWADLFFTKPLLYVLGFLLMDFIYGGLFACFAMSLSEFVKHVFSVFISPFLLISAWGFICIQLGIQNLNPQNFLSPGQNGGAGNIHAIVIIAFILAAVSFFLFYFGGIYNETY